MQNLGVPSVYINWMLAKLNSHTTCLVFNNYTSTPLPIKNGIDQGCLLSIIFYLLYNALLVNVPCPSSNELCIAYIDDITFMVWGPLFKANHCMLVNMMTRKGGALNWSDMHNSMFELDKMVCINFAPPTMSKLNCPSLTIHDQVVTLVKSHTLLGVIMDQTLSWCEQCDKVLAKGQQWAGQLIQLARMSYGMLATTARCLYLSIAVPHFTYAVNIWYSLVSQGPNSCRTGSAGFTDCLARIQSMAARAILGAMHSTPVTSLDAHLNLLPMHLLLNEACQCMAICLAATLTSHPLHKAVLKCLIGRKRHQAPLQCILQFVGVKPSNFEQWPFKGRPLPSSPPEVYQERDAAVATTWADRAHLLVFADVMVNRAGVVAAAVL
ncbi:hypothetical protein OPQ81_005387 [Rhizoctonia solani]|nr:hypothetical protein OPQ81_005387 [Rhizoctonia solani]